MNRRILYATVLSLLLSVAITSLLDVFFPRSTGPSCQKKEAILPQESQMTGSISQETSSDTLVVPEVQESVTIPFETKVLEGSFTTLGASLQSLSFKNYKSETQERIELIDSNYGELFSENWVICGKVLPQKINYRLVSSEENSFVFDAKLVVNGQSVEIIRKYEFSESGYLFKVHNQVKGLGSDKISGTVIFHEHLPAYGERDLTLAHAYTKKFLSINKPSRLDCAWAGASNRYLAMAMIPEESQIIEWSKGEEGRLFVSWLLMMRGEGNQENSCEFSVYLGPKDEKELSRYNKAEANEYSLQGLHLDSLMQKGWLSWVQDLLAQVLGFFYRVFPNWGVAIILLTVLVKILLYPTALKAHVSTAGLQKLQPEIKQLQEKYKDQPSRLQQEMQKLYSKYGVNPLGGCLPLLVQIPIFIALYGLLNSYLPLRGASFIPGWINDLSLPESVFHFSFALPFLGWQDIRLLPIVMLSTQFASGWINLNNSQTVAMSGMQQKFLFYGMPTLFFFILYNMASGLLIYWIINNVLTILQQTYLSRYRLS